MSVYESYINSYIEELDNIDEGALFHTTDGKEIRKQILAILKEYNKSSSFMDRLKKNMKSSAPPASDIQKVKNKISALFKEIYWTKLVIKSMTYSTGYTTVYQEYYCIDLSGLTKNNTAVYTSIPLSGSNIGSSLVNIRDQKLTPEGAKIYEDILKILNNSSYNFVKVTSSNGISFKISNVESRVHGKDMKSLYETL